MKDLFLDIISPSTHQYKKEPGPDDQDNIQTQHLKPINLASGPVSLRDSIKTPQTMYLPDIPPSAASPPQNAASFITPLHLVDSSSVQQGKWGPDAIGTILFGLLSITVTTVSLWHRWNISKSAKSMCSSSPQLPAGNQADSDLALGEGEIEMSQETDIEMQDNGADETPEEMKGGH
jgi:hypothetical protein